MVAISIGKRNFLNWRNYALPSWLSYCKKHNLGLIVITKDLIDVRDPKWKKPTWQKLLIAEHISSRYSNVNRICYLDTDILVSPIAENIFDYFREGAINLVSLINNLPYSREETLKKLSWFRHFSSAGQYPLDSALFMSPKDLYIYSNLEPQNDLACAGVIMFEVGRYKSLMRDYFYEIPSNPQTITDGGDQTHLNYLFQKYCEVNWLPYQFQSIWSYEAANYYPNIFLENNKKYKNACIRDSLTRSSFLHFAGSWYECMLWQNKQILSHKKYNEMLERLPDVNRLPRSGIPIGKIRPKNGLI